MLISYSQFTRETISALYFNISEPNDLSYIKQKTSKYAHLVEKYIMLKTRGDEPVIKLLDRYINEWSLYNNSDPVLRWAKRIRQEYSNYVVDATPCPMINRFEVTSNNNIIDILQNRRSIRRFTEQSIEHDKLEQLIEAANWAPTSCNRQPLKYLFVKDPELKKQLSATISGGKLFAHNAAVILLVLADKRGYRFGEERFTPYQDSAAAIQNILLTVEYLRLGACWCTYTSYSSISDESGVRRMLKIPNRFLICGAIAIGYSAQTVCEVSRGKPEYYIDTFLE